MPDYTQYQFGLFQQHYLPFQQYLSQLQQQHSQLQQQQIQQQQTHHLHNIFFQQSQENQTKPQQDNETAKETEKEKVRSKEGIPLTLANLQVQTHHAKLVGTAYNILLHDACLRGDLTRLGYIRKDLLVFIYLIFIYLSDLLISIFYISVLHGPFRIEGGWTSIFRVIDSSTHSW